MRRFGEKLRDLRHRRGMTLMGLAESLGYRTHGYISEIELPEMGKTKVVGNTIELSATPAEVKSLPCELGMHTEAILLEHGYSADEVGDIQRETEEAKSREFQSGGLQFGSDD